MTIAGFHIHIQINKNCNAIFLTKHLQRKGNIKNLFRPAEACRQEHEKCWFNHDESKHSSEDENYKKYNCRSY